MNSQVTFAKPISVAGDESPIADPKLVMRAKIAKLSDKDRMDIRAQLRVQKRPAESAIPMDKAAAIFFRPIKPLACPVDAEEQEIIQLQNQESNNVLEIPEFPIVQKE
mmetsp:Transcript_96108/g.133347  ORF Transcript_96108/g.133347 Transcript_96108/m.133347 type:complete len:108 (-) Transcript_96108:62-385(-)